MKKKIYKISGMDCDSCAKLIELDLEDAGVKASCSYPKETLEIEFDGTKNTENKIKEIISKSGYSLATA